MCVYLCKYKWCVMLEVNLSIPDSSDWSRATAKYALAGLLRGGIYYLPAPQTLGKVWTGHPAVIPHVEVPVETEQGHLYV